MYADRVGDARGALPRLRGRSVGEPIIAAKEHEGRKKGESGDRIDSQQNHKGHEGEIRISGFGGGVQAIEDENDYEHGAIACSLRGGAPRPKK